MINVRYNGVRLLSEKYDIPVPELERLYDGGIIRECDLRKMLIMEEYNLRCHDEPKVDLRYKLADKYCVSVSLVEKIVLQSYA